MSYKIRKVCLFAIVFASILVSVFAVGCGRTNDSFGGGHKKQWAITYKLGGASNNSQNVSSYREGNEFDLKPATWGSDVFVGWFLDEEFNTPIDKITASTTGNITVYAKFETLVIEGTTLKGVSNWGRANAKTITIPNTITTMDNACFKSVVAKKIEFEAGSTITSIPQETFFGNTNLDSVILPYSITSFIHDNIIQNPFYNCLNLTEIGFIKANGTIVYANSHFIFDTHLATSGSFNVDSYSYALYTAYAGNKMKIITGTKNSTFTDNVSEIGGYAFKGLEINTMTISTTVSKIGASAFSDCKSLTTVYDYGTGSSGVEIGDFAFSDCSAMQKCSLLSSRVTKIGQSAFKGCSALTGTIQLCENLTEIGKYAFSGVGSNPNLVIEFKNSKDWNILNTAGNVYDTYSPTIFGFKDNARDELVSKYVEYKWQRK